MVEEEQRNDQEVTETPAETIAEQIAALREDYEKRLHALQEQLDSERAEYAKAMRETLMSGSAAAEEDNEESIAERIAKKLNEKYKGV